MDSTAFVYQGLLYMISLANRLYLVNRKGEKQLFLKWIKYRYLFLTLHFSGVELIRELPYNDLKSNQRLDYGSYSEGIIMIDSENLIFCSRLLLVGCKTTFVWFSSDFFVNCFRTNFFDNVEEFGYPNISFTEFFTGPFGTPELLKLIDLNSIGLSKKSILVLDESQNFLFTRKHEKWLERKISNSKYGQIVTLKNFTDER